MMGGMNKNGRLPTLILVAALAVCLLAFGTSIADTLKKGIKKGTYKLRVKVTAAGNSNYKAGTRTITVRIKVK